MLRKINIFYFTLYHKFAVLVLMKVRFVPENRVRTVNVEGKVRIKDILKLLNINLETVVVIKGGKVVTEDEFVSDEDEITILKAISGG